MNDEDSYRAKCSDCDFSKVFKESKYASTPKQLAKRAASGHASTGHDVKVVKATDEQSVNTETNNGVDYIQ